MNKDINKTLMALVPILRMNGENVTGIEAVHDWYKLGDREYMKEVAEITYDNGTVRYADIGCDSNLTAIYDVLAVIQQIKPRSRAIERIERGVYSLPSAQTELSDEEKRLIKQLRSYHNGSYATVIDKLIASAQPMRKRGKWRRISADKYVQHATAFYRCSECGLDSLGEANFCPACGCQMMRGDADEPI